MYHFKANVTISRYFL